MADVKTKRNNRDVADFINTIEDQEKKADALVLLHMMKEITGEDAVMWGESIIGFGSYHYKYDTGREGDWMITGFSPRKQNISVYLIYGVDHLTGIEKLGKYKTGKACLYVKRLSDVDQNVLRTLIAESVEKMKQKYGSKP
ncbi:DUF1801 domain-containing protein [Saccharicrinis sp. FJH54]|uniref:DUF1801 domain-containing protein n=1 Tax=Saccharicrinis sp. FJH54 TaxID=3344665 RepID=UPI0035D49AB6